MTGRIDTHCHVVPPEYRDWLEQHSDYRGPYVDWSKDATVEYFERIGVATAILSVSTPGARIAASDDRDETRRIARLVNEFSGELLRDDPARFGFFATLTLPDVDGAIAEAEYAFDELNTDGVVLMTNVEGIYVGAPEWDPLLEYLDQRDAIVYLHPTGPVGPGVPGVTPGVSDFLADTVRSAVNLTRNGCLLRYPNLKFLLSHGGGFLPYAALRIARMALPTVPQNEAVAQLQRFYFDTALTSGPFGLPSLLAFAEDTHVTFGSDWPYAPTPDAAAFTGRLDAYPLTPDQADAINRGNAELLFPRLVPALGAAP